MKYAKKDDGKSDLSAAFKPSRGSDIKTKMESAWTRLTVYKSYSLAAHCLKLSPAEMHKSLKETQDPWNIQMW